MNQKLRLQLPLLNVCVLLSAVLCPNPEAAAAEAWEMRATAQAVYAGFKDAELRDGLFGAGFFLRADYLENYGFNVGYNYTEIQGKGDGTGTFDTLDESTLYLSGNLSSYPDSLGGKINWRLDTYFVTNDLNVNSPGGANGSPNGPGPGPGGANNSPNASGLRAVTSNVSGDVIVINPIIGFMGYEEKFGFDFGYAYSNYDYGTGNEYQVHQVAPTIGFAIGGPANWIQLRGFFIQLSDAAVNGGKKNTAAVEAKWTHWFAPDAPLRLRSIGVNVMGGTRFLAVDPDAAIVYTIADEQQGSVALHGSLNLGEQTSLMLQAGFEQYEDRARQNEYDSSYIYVNLAHKW